MSNVNADCNCRIMSVDATAKLLFLLRSMHLIRNRCTRFRYNTISIGDVVFNRFYRISKSFSFCWFQGKIVVKHRITSKLFRIISCINFEIIDICSENAGIYCEISCNSRLIRIYNYRSCNCKCFVFYT